MRARGQSTLEFTMVFTITILFVILTANIFVWINHNMVRRQVEYEQTRTQGENGDIASVGKTDFFTPDNKLPELNVFIAGGYR